MNFVVRDPAGLSLQALFQSSGVDGVRARTQLFERAVEGLTSLISRLRAPDTEVLRFPPVTNRAHIEKSGYLHSFPHLLGAVCCLHGGESEIRAALGGSGANNWVAATTPTDLVLTPSALGAAPVGLESTGDPVMCRAWTLLGVPCVALPFNTGPFGLPLSVQLIGPLRGDDQLIAWARWVEQRLS